MVAPPAFVSLDDYVSRLSDVDFWRPHVVSVLERHGLDDPREQPVAGWNPTYPTFLAGDVVVKLFGHVPSWRQTHQAERAAHDRIATAPGIAAPRVLAQGRLCAGSDDAPWPYLVTTRMRGVSLRDADLSHDQRLSLAADLGRLMRRVHGLRPPRDMPVVRHDRSPGSIAAAAARSSLPPHLVAQVGDYVSHLRPFDRVFVHGDLCAAHVFVERGSLAGVIDWGDAVATDRHYELIQVHRDAFRCEKTLLRAFLDAADWPVDDGFPRQALGLALYRQAVGLAQHHTMDVFEPVAAVLPLRDIATLDELASELFAV